MARGGRRRNANRAATPATPGVATTAGYPPTLIAANATFTVPADQQVLMADEIDMASGAELVIDGLLTEVD